MRLTEAHNDSDGPRTVARYPAKYGKQASHIVNGLFPAETVSKNQVTTTAKTGTYSLHRVMCDSLNPVPRGDDSHVLVRRSYNALAGPFDCCEHGCVEEGGRGYQLRSHQAGGPFISREMKDLRNVWITRGVQIRAMRSCVGVHLCISYGATTWGEAGQGSMVIGWLETSEIAPNGLPCTGVCEKARDSRTFDKRDS